ncbi:MULTISPECIES: CYTH and CHAD domain-containing protein [unclassified Rathayibacter]|uniref:CYTH and CHAD domain-containing protein n=1 Tax=unclassified Rathayibacter TaxID=2609250 RepID=UPI00188DA96E|nr:MULTISPECIES: CYTH and CHAD domain-containing protein [unclassified Rathayibacter]MBF4461989.1 CYTH and CHAD domain-containing protein [Rathayibacter sp. VKM Ac-2879]MBF4503968.1 CYTH and CHAD domain-containing protein [Rathayibacter sp. VKM Ac-2878]
MASAETTGRADIAGEAEADRGLDASTRQRARRRVQTEVERKYDVGADTVLPRLVGAGAVASARAEPPIALSADYFDTAERALSRARITLRRREGGEDEGWHVKLPGSAGRTEIHTPLTPRGSVPSSVREPVLGSIGRAPLEPLARLETVRAITRVADADGRVLAEIADDLVTALDERTGRERRWREWEVELVDARGAAGEAVLDAIEKRLLAAGARPARSASKLARATGGPLEDTVRAPRDGGEAAVAAVRELLGELRAVDPRVRLETDDALHRMRTLARRLRSVLAASRSVLDRASTDPIRSELRWLGRVLGAARDEEVLADRLRSGLASTGLDEGSAASLIEEIERRHALALRRVARTLRGGRYLALLASIDALLASPPRTGKAKQSVKKLVRRSVSHERSRVREARRAAEGTEGRHELRIAAKRLRYTVEAWRAVVPAAVGPAQRSWGAVGEELADALGDERDALAARELLAGASRVDSADDAFARGALWVREGRRARRATKAAERALARFDALAG